jgi:D-alanyl-D-alanine dipeptidase
MRYNITQRFNILLIATTIFSTQAHVVDAQETAGKSLRVINAMEAYNQSVRLDSNMRMVNLQQYIPGIILDLRYASSNNFMHRVMYPELPGYSFLRLPAAKGLLRVQTALNKIGMGLKIFDAYRPYAVTEKFWELVHDARYVADPKQGSGHNRGIAVDLTIVDLKTGKELKMPTGFDNFTDSAHHDFTALSAEVLHNRTLLKETMEKAGFLEFATEWWHYSLPDPEKYDVLNLSFEQLERQ